MQEQMVRLIAPLGAQLVCRCMAQALQVETLASAPLLRQAVILVAI
jgi:hypothetical protein